MPSALSVARPAVVAVVLLAAVAATGVVLYAYWPAGVALGLALGAGAVLAIGARMQVVERQQPHDADLAETLGVRSAVREPVIAPVVPAPAVAAPVERVPALRVQPEVLYFTSDDDPDVVEARELVVHADTTADVVSEVDAHADAAPGDAVAVAAAPAVEPEPTSAEPVSAAPAGAEPAGAQPIGADPVRADLEGLKAALGDDYRDFARAARLVVSTQYASAARLQRDLDLPYSRARRLLADLEQQHFVGPATGSLPRQVLLPKERLPEVEQLLAEV